MNIEQLTHTIKKMVVDKKPVLIAIDGFGGSGKTTIANKLVEALGDAYVVHLDEFIVKDKMHEPSWEEGFDLQRLVEQVLEPLFAGKQAKYQPLFWETNTLGEYQTIPPVEYVIVEGITSSHPEVSKYYDYKVWVDTPIEVAKARGKARDAGNENEGMWDLWAENDLKYVARYHPETTADTVISGC